VAQWSANGEKERACPDAPRTGQASRSHSVAKLCLLLASGVDSCECPLPPIAKSTVATSDDRAQIAEAWRMGQIDPSQLLDLSGGVRRLPARRARRTTPCRAWHDLDQRRGWARRTPPILRWLLADVEANEKVLAPSARRIGAYLLAAQSTNWCEAAQKARYLLNLSPAPWPRKAAADRRSSPRCSMISSGSDANRQCRHPGGARSDPPLAPVCLFEKAGPHRRSLLNPVSKLRKAWVFERG
jgi:hypothetical protein